MHVCPKINLCLLYPPKNFMDYHEVWFAGIETLKKNPGSDTDQIPQSRALGRRQAFASYVMSTFLSKQ